MQFILCKYQFEVNSIRSQSQLLEVDIYITAYLDGENIFLLAATRNPSRDIAKSVNFA